MSPIKKSKLIMGCLRETLLRKCLHAKVIVEGLGDGGIVTTCKAL